MIGFDCVLGAGPAAVACADSLLRQNRRVIMVAPDKALDTDSQNLKRRFVEHPNAPEFVAAIREKQKDLPPALRGKKRPFGSRSFYEAPLFTSSSQVKDADIGRSWGMGGLSAIWGATVMPFAAASFRHWPVTADEMAPYYRQVAEWMPVPYIDDALTPLFPNYGEARPLPLSDQGKIVMRRLMQHREALKDQGLTFGQSRNAIGPCSAGTKTAKCQSCGLCMYGCPYDAIFNAASKIEDFKKNPLFTHKPDFEACSFTETATDVQVFLKNTSSGEQQVLSCDRLFIATGTAETVRIVAVSMKWFDHDFYLSDTQQLSIPALLTRPCSTGAIPPSMAAGQIFLEANDPNWTPDRWHLQIYGFNPFIADILAARWGNWVYAPIWQPMLDRLMIIMGYLPNEVSGQIVMRLRHDEAQNPYAVYQGIPNPLSRKIARHIGRRLLRNTHRTGLLPLLPFTELPQVGASMHITGGLPMKNEPTPFECDRLGRPGALRHVHVVDGACFPTTCGEHPTFTLMANAARIANEAPTDL